MTNKNFTRNEHIERFKSNLSTIFHNFKVDFAVLAGSWARDEQQWWSDIDIFVHLPGFLDLPSDEMLDILINLNMEADKLLHLDKLEIRILEKQTLHTQFNILSDGIILYEARPYIRNSYLEKLLPVYYDHIIWYSNFLKQSLGVEK